MAKKISQSDVGSAANTASGRKLSNGVSTRGSDADQAQWDQLRAKACQLFLSDPDARVYLFYLASNGLGAALREYHAILCECIVLAESNSSLPETQTEQRVLVQERKQALADLVRDTRNRGLGQQTDTLKKLKERSAAYLEASSKQFVRSRRVERSPKSKSALSDLIEELTIRTNDITNRIGALQAVFGVGTVLTEGATFTILPNLAATLRNTRLSPEDEALRVAAAVGAYDAFSRDVNCLYLVHTQLGRPFPLTVKESTGYFELIDEDGVAVNPALLDVAVGSVIKSGQYETTVASIDATKIALTEEIVLSSGLIAQTLPQSKLGAFRSSSLKALASQRFWQIRGLERPYQMRKFSRPDAYAISKSLSALAAPLADFTSESLRSMALLNLDAPQTTSLIQDLLDFDPQVPKRSSRAVDGILEAMKSKGLTKVYSNLLRANLEILGLEIVGEVRDASDAAFEIGDTMNMIIPTLRV